MWTWPVAKNVNGWGTTLGLCSEALRNLKIPTSAGRNICLDIFQIAAALHPHPPKVQGDVLHQHFPVPLGSSDHKDFPRPGEQENLDPWTCKKMGQTRQLKVTLSFSLFPLNSFLRWTFQQQPFRLQELQGFVKDPVAAAEDPVPLTLQLASLHTPEPLGAVNIQ